MKLSNEPSRLAATLAVLVTALFLVTTLAFAAIDPDAAYNQALDKVEAAESLGLEGPEAFEGPPQFVVDIIFDGELPRDAVDSRNPSPGIPRVN